MFRYIVFFCSFGGVQQASKITGPRKRPSQSPSMRLLGMLHIADPDGGFPKDWFCKMFAHWFLFALFTTCLFMVKFWANTRRHITEYRDLHLWLGKYLQLSQRQPTKGWAHPKNMAGSRGGSSHPRDPATDLGVTIPGASAHNSSCRNQKTSITN